MGPFSAPITPGGGSVFDADYHDWIGRFLEGLARLTSTIHRIDPAGFRLRHTAGTLIRREFGLEAAQLALGHSSAKVTDAVYAERDMARVIEVMKRIG